MAYFVLILRRFALQIQCFVLVMKLKIKLVIIVQRHDAFVVKQKS